MPSARSCAHLKMKLRLSENKNSYFRTQKSAPIHMRAIFAG